MSKIADSVKEAADKLASELGYEIVDIEYAKKYSQMNLTFVLYKKDGIDLNDCENFHKRISDILDEIDPTNGEPYILNVSSMGLDRPIKTDDDLRRNLNLKVEISLYVPVNKKKKFQGTVVSYDKDTVTISDNEENKLILNRKDIALMKPAIDF